jgi:hypothetical protein
MNEKKAIKAVCFPLAVVLISAPFLEAVTFDNPHAEPMQHQEEPRMTFDSPHTTTSAAMYNLAWFGSGLESIPVPVLRLLKK